MKTLKSQRYKALYSIFSYLIILSVLLSYII